MAYIQVNTTDIVKAKTEIVEYLEELKHMMDVDIDLKFHEFADYWDSDDYPAIIKYWYGCKASGSACSNTINDLTHYVEFLDYCKNRYVETQNQIYELSSKLL